METLKVLFVGNSFARDTVELAPDIAKSLGIDQIKFANLYVGGCSIDMHYAHAIGDLPAYDYYINTGEAWTYTPEHRISDAVREEDWDWIVIQHGTRGTSRYTSPECYDNLAPLVRYLKSLAPSHTRIAFNLTWMGESTYQHHEIISYGGDMTTMRRRLIEVTQACVLTQPQIDLIIPTGTAIENARTSHIGLLTRDCFHLSVDKGRYIAALTFLAAITGLDVSGISRAPTGVDDYARRVAIEAAQNALRAPFTITPSKL